MNGNIILETKDLRTYFRTGSDIARAVDGVSFSIHKGETYAIVGESGCGKSVTALSILQLVARPAGYIAGGSIQLHGKEISSLPPVAMRKIRGNRISMIFQEPMTALNPVFTIGTQISEAIILHQKTSRKEAYKQSIEMLDKVGIPDAIARFNEYPHQMSGGMRQRVMIAMALVCRPELLIADEPTTALDVTIQAQILTLIHELQKEMGTAILLITHDMGIVRENADRVGVMYAGQIVEEAHREHLFSSPMHPYTQLLLRSIPSRTRRDKALATIKGIVPKATQWPAGCRFSTRCPLVMDICRREKPESCSLPKKEHSVSCFLFNKHDQSHDHAPIELRDPAPPSALQTSIERLKISDLKMHFPIQKGLFKRTVGHVKAVDGVSLSIYKGETLALVGESGCGKTTVGKCIVRLLHPNGGSIQFAQQDLLKLDNASMKKYRRHIQMIFQDPFSCLNPRTMIGETISEGVKTHFPSVEGKERSEKIAELMTRVGLSPDMSTRYPHEFSGGQRQRIGIARALAVNPELIICDEATSSLDVSVQAQILNLLKKLQSELGISYLFITHNLSVVEYLADRVAVMYLGRIVEEGSTQEIFHNPTHPYTKALLSAAPHVDRTTGIKKIILHGDVPSPVNPPIGCHFHPRCSQAQSICSQAYPEQVEVTSSHTCRCVMANRNAAETPGLSRCAAS